MNPLMHEMAEWDPSLNRCSEVEEEIGQIEDVQSWLKYHLPFWAGTKVRTSTMDYFLIRDDYKLSFHSVSSQFCKPNQPSAMENPQFVTETLLELKRNRCIQEVCQQPVLCL